MNTSVKLFSTVLIFAILLASCSSSNSKFNKEAQENTENEQKIKIEAQENTKTEQGLNAEEQKLIGFWHHGIRPGAIGFFPDKTFKDYLPSQDDKILYPDTGAVVFQGTWKLENNQLTRWRTSEDKADVQKIVWENDSLFSFDSFDKKRFSTMSSFLNEHGMFRFNTAD